MSQTQTTITTSVDLPRASLHGSTSGDRAQANIELAELGRTESIKSIKISTGPSGPSSETISKPESWTAKVQFATLCWTLFLAGWNDGTTGPLLPRIQEVYHVIMLISYNVLSPNSQQSFRPILLLSPSFSCLTRS